MLKELLLSVLSEANTDNMTNPDISLSLWRERNSIMSDTETETEEEPSYIPNHGDYNRRNILDCQLYDRWNTPDQD